MCPQTFSSTETSQSGVSSHYLGQPVVMCSTVYRGSPHLQRALSPRPHFCIAALKSPTPVLRLRVVHWSQGCCWPERLHLRGWSWDGSADFHWSLHLALTHEAVVMSACALWCLRSDLVWMWDLLICAFPVRAGVVAPCLTSAGVMPARTGRWFKDKMCPLLVLTRPVWCRPGQSL